jgi:hypothetical protein
MDYQVERRRARRTLFIIFVVLLLWGWYVGWLQIDPVTINSVAA